MKKKVLFVTYGGGHVKMIIPVVKKISEKFDVEVLALTAAGPVLKNQKIPHRRYLDFIDLADEAALAEGRNLAKKFHAPHTGIDFDESAMYLGIGYSELLRQHGSDRARELLTTNSLQDFHPFNFLGKVLDRLNPDLVVTTNSPRSERAALTAAETAGIPSLALVDLFGFGHWHKLSASFVGVFHPSVVANLKEQGAISSDSKFVVTGNPAFDAALKHPKDVSVNLRQRVFPTLRSDKRWLLWVDTPGYWRLNPNKFVTRDRQAIISDLEILNTACVLHDVELVVRPHPSQAPALYQEWLGQRSRPGLVLDTESDLLTTLQCVDSIATYNSTVSIEALALSRPVLQMRIGRWESDMPLIELGTALGVYDEPGLADAVHAISYNTSMREQLISNGRQLFPFESATDRVDALITQLLS
jgi:hypothetical protein